MRNHAIFDEGDICHLTTLHIFCTILLVICRSLGAHQWFDLFFMGEALLSFSKAFSWGVAIVCFATLYLHTASAQTSLLVEMNEVWIDFPESIDFRLVASANALSIDSVTIEYGVDALNCGDVSAVAELPLTSHDTVDLTWRWDLLEDTFIPPGSHIWWRWHITTVDGDTFVTPTETTIFLDDWFVWQTVSAENVTVHWYRGPQLLGQEILKATLDSIERLANDTGLRLIDPVHLYVYDESFDLQASLPGAPAWAGGAAFPEYNVVLITANMNHLDYAKDTTRHEIGHLVIGRLTFNCTNGLPTWLNEGLAMIAEGHEDARSIEHFREAIDSNTILTIPQLESAFSINANRAHLSYTQSHNLTRYLIDTYGQENMLALLQTFRKGATPDNALLEIYGFNTNGLEDEWRIAINAQPRAQNNGDSTVPAEVPTLSLYTLPNSTIVTPVSSPIAISISTPLPTGVPVKTAQPALAHPVPTKLSLTPPIRERHDKNIMPVVSIASFMTITSIIVIFMYKKKRISNE